MNTEREQLKVQYKNYLDKLNSSENLQSSIDPNVKDALMLLLHAKYLDFIKEDETDAQKNNIESQIKIAIYGSILSIVGSIIMAIVTFYFK